VTDVADHPPLHLVRPGKRPRQPEAMYQRLFAVIIVLLLAAVGWLIVAGTPSGHHVSAPVVSSPPRPVVVRPSARSGVTAACHLPAGSQVVPTPAPVGVTWDLFNTVALPYSATAGPEFVSPDGQVARCYAHSPTGSLIADVQISARHLISYDWRAVNAAQVVPGSGVKVFDADRALVTGNLSEPGRYCESAAYSFLSYSSVAASIEVVVRCGANLEAMVTNVAWSPTDSDWRLVLLPDGSEARTATIVDNLTGFVPFGGV